MVNVLWHCFAEISPLEKRNLFGCCLKPHARYCFHPFPFWICHTESRLRMIVFCHFAVLFMTQLCFSHEVLSKGINIQGVGGVWSAWISYLSCISSASDSSSVVKKLNDSAISCICSVFSGSLKTFPSKPAKRASNACLPHIAVSKELDGSYANDTLWRWAMCWEGWGRWGNWHSLQLMSTLCRKIRSIWCYKPK